MSIKRRKSTYCCFCGRDEHECTKLIVGPDSHAICNFCVDLCVEIIAGKAKKIIEDGNVK